MSEEKPTEEIYEDIPEDAVTMGTSFEDLEKEFGNEETVLEDDALPVKPPVKNFWLSKQEIAEFAYNASVDFRLLVEDFEKANEPIRMFHDMTLSEQEEWGEIAGMALRMQGDNNPDNWARVVHAKTSMGLLKDGVRFDEKFNSAVNLSDYPAGDVTSPLVAPWECQPYQRRIPLLMFKQVCSVLHSVWDKENELLTR